MPTVKNILITIALILVIIYLIMLAMVLFVKPQQQQIVKVFKVTQIVNDRANKSKE